MPHIAKLEFVSVKPDDSGAVALNFRPHRPLDFKAGQFGLWFVPGAGLKPFTIASAPEEELIALGTDLGSQSRFKQTLAKLTPGDMVRFIGPLANFTLDKSATEVVMLAQGIGVTPFRSMLRHASMAGLNKRTTLIQVGRKHDFRRDTEGSANEAHYPTSREAFAKKLEMIVPERAEATFMISGTPAFVKSTASQLKAYGVRGAQVKRGAFYGWSGKQSPKKVYVPGGALG